MGIQGMELFAIGVVIILFVAVLKQFGILEPMSLEGKHNTRTEVLPFNVMVICLTNEALGARVVSGAPMIDSVNKSNVVMFVLK